MDNLVLIGILQECTRLLAELQSLSEQEKESIRKCVKGELLDEYLRNGEKADVIMRQLQQAINHVQSEQMLGL